MQGVWMCPCFLVRAHGSYLCKYCGFFEDSGHQMTQGCLDIGKTFKK